MTTIHRPLKIAIVGTNNDSMYSGGRYHALIMAYSLARNGANVTFITNKKPRFFDDLDPLCPGNISYVFTGDFQEKMPQGDFDFVILIPTGIFLPKFYESILSFARDSHARMALVNFESGNWFNAISPSPRDLRLWDYWHRAIVRGGVVLSSLRISDENARDFYRAYSPQDLRFEVCAPPINSPAADISLQIPKDGSVVTFVRSSDPHKGGADLLELSASVLAGRTLKVIAGGPIDPEFQRALQKHYEPAGAKLEFHVAVSDKVKFELIGQAQALLFPSRFEGFGYPPVEAAYMGTEAVCYDLAVLKETVGSVAHMAAVGNIKALENALVAALKAPERRNVLHDSVKNLVDIDVMGLRLTDILLRSHDTVPSLASTSGSVLWGPFPDDKPDASIQEVSPFPAMLNSYVAYEDKAYLSLRVCSPASQATVTVSVAGEDLQNVCTIKRGRFDNWDILDVTGTLSTVLDGPQFAEVTITSPKGAVVKDDTVQLIQPKRAQKSTEDFQLSGLWVEENNSRIQFEYQGSGDRVFFSENKKDWQEAPIVNGIVTLSVNGTKPFVSGLSVYVCAGEEVIAYLEGFPPIPERPDFRQSVGQLQIANLNDKHWENGILRHPSDADGGVLVCEGNEHTPFPEAGDMVRLASGRILKVASVTPKGHLANISFFIPLNTLTEGAPNSLQVLVRKSSLLPKTSGTHWVNNTWNGEGNFKDQCVLVPYERVAALKDRALCLLCEDGTQIPIIATSQYDQTTAMVWLDSPVTSHGNFGIIRALHAIDMRRCDVRTDKQAILETPIWRRGLKEERVFVLRSEVVPEPGDALVFENTKIRQILETHSEGDQTVLVLDLSLPNEVFDAETIRFARATERADISAMQMEYPGRVASPRVGKFLTMVDEFRKTHAPLSILPSNDRPRVLFTSIVPPDPADQGNRIVTRNFITHLLSQGFDVDLLLIGDVQPDRIAKQYGDRVRVFTWPFPDWSSEPSAALRQRTLEALRSLDPAPMEKETFDALLREAATYHPFFIVPDAFVRIARALYRTHEYHSIVCNYTHLVKVACELRAIRPLPPVTVVTHDALSRLPLEFAGQPLNTMYRMCSPETERDVLNAIPGAVILAISTSEQKYFKEIGVTNPIELCEYDGLKECSQYRVSANGFNKKRLIFHASGNPMNRVAIDWFIEKCWASVHKQVPDAKLVICGGISKQIRHGIPGVELHGILSREKLMEMLGTSSIAINPTLAGTGLKIKTVEAACAGLPSVCLPPAIEGLEEVADRFCLLETEPEGFSKACIRLLTEQEFWSQMHQSSLELAAERFSEKAIYGGVDHRMGWDVDCEERFQTPRLGYRADPVLDVVVTDDELSLQAKEKLSLVSQLAALGEFKTSYKIFGDIMKGYNGRHINIIKRSAYLASKNNDLQGVLSACGELYANNPADGDALLSMLVETSNAGHKNLAEDIWKRFALALPASSVTYDSAKEVNIASALASSKQWLNSKVNAPLGKRLWFKDVISVASHIGLGWSPMEHWGFWSNGRFARLELSFKATSSALQISFRGHVEVGKNPDPRIVRVYVNGNLVDMYTISPQEIGDIITLNIPSQSAPRDQLSIEFQIENPVPLRNEDGSLKDQRMLGMALQAVLVREC